MSGRLQEPDAEFWNDEVWAESRVCGKCQREAKVGAKMTFADGTDQWLCKACAVGKVCYRCRAPSNKGATITFGDGSKQWFCKPCAMHKLAKNEQRSAAPATVASPTVPNKKPDITVTGAPVPLSAAKTAPPPLAARPSANLVAAQTQPATAANKRSSGHEKVCTYCGKVGGAGARVTLADGSTEWFCKNCALKPALARTEHVVSGATTATTVTSTAPPSATTASTTNSRTSVDSATHPTSTDRRVSQQYMSLGEMQGMRTLRPDATAGEKQNVSTRSTAAVAAAPAAAKVPPVRVSPRVVSPRTAATPGGGGGDAYQSSALIDRERMAKDFDQCVIVTAEVQRGAQIGAGSQGMVFRGVWRGTDVAIKDWHDGANPSYREQFRAEALKMRALPQHRNVCQFLGVLLLPSFAIVTRFYALGGLEGVVYKDRPDIAPLSKAFVRRVLLGVARGLRHLHQHGIVHRDIACRNVLLDDVSASYSAEQRASEQCDAGPVIDVAITDFGMAREGAGDSLNGMTTSRFGPIKWMSPEQIEAQRWSAASDVYSFGVLVGELLERAPPMLGLEVVDAAHMICEGVRGAIVPEPHVDLRHLLKWCWEVDAAARPSMSDVVAGLKSMPLDVFVVPQTAPTKTDRKARGEANRAALALRQAQLKPPGTASGDRPPSPSLRERIGSMLRRQSNEVQPPQPPPPPVTVANPLFGVSLLNAVEADGADAHGVPLLLAQCMAMLRAHRQHSTLELSRMVGAARQQQQSAASDLYAVPNLERPASPRAALDAEANDPTTRVMHVEGIFRLSGSVAQIERVKRCALDGGQAAREALLLISDPHTIAGVMKLWLRELVDRVIDTPLMNALFDVLARERELEARIAAARRCLARASSVRRAILEQLMWICQSVVTHESVTRMTPAALAVVFAPSLTDCTLTQTKPAIDLLVFMIQNAVAIFAFEDDQDYAFLPADHTTRAERDARQIRETFVDNARLAPPETDQYGLLPARSVSPSRTPEQRSPRSLQYAQLGPEDIIAHVDLEYGDLPPED